MIVKTFTVLNKLGVHARPSALLTKTANLFECSIQLEKAGKKADAKSILSVMTLAMKQGDEITLTFDGINEKAAAEAVTSLFESRFGEEE